MVIYLMPSLMLIFFAMVGGMFCLASFVTGDMASRQQRKKRSGREIHSLSTASSLSTIYI